MRFAGLAAGTQVAFDATRLHYDEIDVINTFHYRPADVEEAHRLLATGTVNLRPIISGVRDLAGIVDVFASLDRGHGVKFAILPEDFTVDSGLCENLRCLLVMRWTPRE